MDAHLHTLISAHFCRSTHHYIVMDALQRLGGPDADAWRRLLLHEHTALLKGAKAPDTTFKDFKNHVLHVGGDAEWGGARGAATEWYNTAVEALAAKKWRAGAYALGVLSHYFTDPIQPFHTGQTEAEGAVHRALEWSVFKARPELKARMDALGARAVRGGDDTNFVSDMVGAGARISHRHYDTFLDHYDLDAGTRSPEAGLDDALLDATAELLAYAVAGVAHLFERAFAEAGVAPKPVRLSFDVVLAEIGKPLRVVLSKIEDANTRRAVSAAYAEYQNTGKVIRRLSKDDATIRALHAREVREIELEALDAEAPAPVGTRHGQPLAGISPAEDIAPQTAPAPAPEPRVEAEASEVQDAPSSRLDRPKTPTLDRVLRDLAPQHDDAMEPQEAPEETGAIEPEMDQALEAPSEIEAVTSDDSSEQAIDPATPHEDDTSTEPENREAPDPRALLETASEPAKPAPRRSTLTDTSDVVDAPSIGKRTARHLRRVRVTTIGDLLNADPMDLAERVNLRHITAQAITDWQDQTRLKMALPSLRVHDVQILVGAGIRSIEDLQDASATTLFEAATVFARTPAAERIIHDADKPTREEVDDWISTAKARTG